MHYTISSLYTVKKHYLSIKCTVFYFTRISLYTIYLEIQKSCKVRATYTDYIDILYLFVTQLVHTLVYFQNIAEWMSL